MKSIIRRSRTIAVAVCSLWFEVSSQGLDSSIQHALQFANRQLRRTVAEMHDGAGFPRSTRPDGSWQTLSSRAWTSGFFPGCLWYMYELTRDSSFKTPARKWTESLSDVQDFRGSHDVGFVVFNSYGNGYRLDPSDSYRRVILQTALSLATRFNSTVGCIRSWDHGKWNYPVIIDNMMNLELLFWAADHGGPALMRTMAVTHALNTMRNHVRSDGGTYHVVDYDTANGAVITRTTHQGFADESVWARGQAWAVYGFTMSYRYTRDERFLETAERTADFLVSHLPGDGVPYWDFSAPNIPQEERDASAGVIASSALLELSRFTKDQERKSRYRTVAEKILLSLCSPAYLAEGTASHGILLHSVGSKPANSEVDVSIIYADYYFLEAVKRYRQLKDES